MTAATITFVDVKYGRVIGGRKTTLQSQYYVLRNVGLLVN